MLYRTQSPHTSNIQQVLPNQSESEGSEAEQSEAEGSETEQSEAEGSMLKDAYMFISAYCNMTKVSNTHHRNQCM